MKRLAGVAAAPFVASLFLILAAAVAPRSPARAGAPAEPAPLPAPPERAQLPVARCGACHRTIVDEWRGALHAASTAETNGLYRIMQQKARAALGPPADARCSRCHYPPWAGIGQAPAVPVEGVSCIVCHEVAVGHPGKRLPDGKAARLAVPPDAADPAEALCLSCHDVLRSPAGHPVCTTGPEAQAARAGRCVDCHMGKEAGPQRLGAAGREHRRHDFPGGRSAALLAQAVTLSLRRVAPAAGGAEAAVEAIVQTGEVGHAVPTGTPMRSLALRVVAYDAADNVLWQNAGALPTAGSPDAVFQHVFTGPNGERPVPPFLSALPGDDRRLHPGTPHILRYSVPAGTHRVTATLAYSRGPAPLLEAAGLPESERLPREMARAELRL